MAEKDLKHLPPFRIPVFRNIVTPCQVLCQMAFSSHLLAVAAFPGLLSSSATSSANIS
jgi:hypothetical protein